MNAKRALSSCCDPELIEKEKLECKVRKEAKEKRILQERKLLNNTLKNFEPSKLLRLEMRNLKFLDNKEVREHSCNE